MRFKTKHAPDTTVAEFIRNHLGKSREESISFLVQEIRMHGMRFPTNHSAAMDEFKRLGFQLRHERNKYGALLRTYVVSGLAGRKEQTQ